MKCWASGFNKLFKGFCGCALIGESFLLDHVVQMLEKVIVSVRQAR